MKKILLSRIDSLRSNNRILVIKPVDSEEAIEKLGRYLNGKNLSSYITQFLSEYGTISPSSLMMYGLYGEIPALVYATQRAINAGVIDENYLQIGEDGGSYSYYISLIDFDDNGENKVIAMPVHCTNICEPDCDLIYFDNFEVFLEKILDFYIEGIPY